jgi:hypothetical protein
MNKILISFVSYSLMHSINAEQKTLPAIQESKIDESKKKEEELKKKEEAAKGISFCYSQIHFDINGRFMSVVSSVLNETKPKELSLYYNNSPSNLFSLADSHLNFKVYGKSFLKNSFKSKDPFVYGGETRLMLDTGKNGVKISRAFIFLEHPKYLGNLFFGNIVPIDFFITNDFTSDLIRTNGGGLGSVESMMLYRLSNVPKNEFLGNMVGHTPSISWLSPRVYSMCFGIGYTATTRYKGSPQRSDIFFGDGMAVFDDHALHSGINFIKDIGRAHLEIYTNALCYAKTKDNSDIESADSKTMSEGIKKYIGLNTSKKDLFENVGTDKAPIYVEKYDNPLAIAAGFYVNFRKHEIGFRYVANVKGHVPLHKKDLGANRGHFFGAILAGQYGVIRLVFAGYAHLGNVVSGEKTMAAGGTFSFQVKTNKHLTFFTQYDFMMEKTSLKGFNKISDTYPFESKYTDKYSLDKNGYSFMENSKCHVISLGVRIDF